jgi:hypothetical protein
VLLERSCAAEQGKSGAQNDNGDAHDAYGSCVGWEEGEEKEADAEWEQREK